MAKIKTLFYCANCGASSVKWLGKCPSCGEWNTYVEEVIAKETKQDQKQKSWKKSTAEHRGFIPLTQIKLGQTQRISTGNQEFDRVLGGGLVPGSLILIGGEPGIGKSTLLLQIALQLNLTVAYVSGEESEEQIRMRAERLEYTGTNCLISTETNLTRLLDQIKTANPQLIIIDSIQTLSSPYLDSTPGSVSQIRECTSDLQRFCKETNVAVVIIGHITKEGNIAGPKLLEHIVDVVLQFEGDQNYAYRILRSLKNRFGPTEELGIFEMRANGMREVSNPSELLISQNEDELSGSAIASTVEGARPVLLEVQALVTGSVYGTPQRSATGFDLRRLSMLLAVLEKRCGLPFGQNDVFLNIAGGIRVADPAIDLAIVSALISSLNNIYIDRKTCFSGEVGLSGEVRAVSKIEQRIQEANRLGYHQIFISKYNLKGLDPGNYQLEIKGISSLEYLVEELFGVK